jgi:carbon monoxide dehydrogenase subunit G
MITDPQQVAGCMPGVQKVEVRSPEDFEAVVRVGVSFVRGDFILHFRVIEKVPPERTRLKVHGRGMGSAIDTEIVVTLAGGTGDGTSMKWEADAAVSGKIASLGQRLMESQAEKIITQFFECFREKLEKT